MNFFDVNSEADNLGAEEERILASFTRRLIEIAAVARRFTSFDQGEIMKSKIIGIIAATALSAASTAARAGEDYYQPRFALLAGQIWNGTSSSFVADFHDKPSCEAAFVAYKTDGQQQIAAARPKLTKEGVTPIFWHTCSIMNSAMPS